MKPFSLELMLTPIAAPETRRLRAMRWGVVVGCALVALGTANIHLVERVLGRPGVAVLAGLTLALALLVVVYALAKIRADADHCDRIGSDPLDGGEL